MSIQSKMQDGVLTISVTGRFTFQLFREFSDAYQNIGDKPTLVDVDLGAVDYVDSAALGMLLSMSGHFEDGTDIRLSKPNSTVRKILEIARFDKTFDIV